MQIVLGLCVLAILASASADCGCLKCNPHLQVVSPRYSPCKVIYRNNNRNVPSIAPYKLQAAIPPPPPVFVPKEYDYKMQYLPYATPYTGSVYEYGLQAAIPPPPGPLHIPLQNLRTGVERVVMDAPYNAVLCGTSNCNPGLPRKIPAPLPIHLHHHHHHDCECESCGCNTCGRNTCGCTSTKRNPYGFEVYQPERNDCEDEDREDLSRNGDCKGPIIEPLLPPLCRRYAKNFNGNVNAPFVIGSDIGFKFRRKRDLNSRIKRDIIDLPMNFMFKFVPNLFRGPIVHAINTIQHNMNPAVLRARANASKHRMQAHLARSKHKLNTQKVKHYTSSPTNKNSKHSPTLPGHHSSTPDENKYPNILLHRPPHRKDLPSIKNEIPPALGTLKHKDRIVKMVRYHDQQNQQPYHPNKKMSSRSNHVLQNEDSYNFEPYQRFGYKDLHQGRRDNKDDFLGVTNDLLKDLFSVFRGRERPPRKNVPLVRQNHITLEELRQHFQRKGYSNEEINDILLEKMKRFNEIYERVKAKIHPEIHKDPAKIRRRRSVLLDTDQFQLPFFEIEDEVLDDYYSGSDENIVGLKHKKRRKQRRYREDSDSDSEEEILGASHPLHDHPFVVFLRTPLQLLHHFHDIRKNFRPILYSFPKILQSSRKYLKDFGKNLQTGVLDFASNIMGDFNNQVARRSDSLFFPTRQRRSIGENIKTTTETPHKRDKRYILKVVDEKEVQEFLEEKLGGYFDDEDDDEKKEEGSDETVGDTEKSKKDGEKKFIVKKLSPKLILDNNGKPFIEINGNKRPLFFGKNKHKNPIVQKSKHKTHEAMTTDSGEKLEGKEKEEDIKHEEINDKIDDIIAQAKQKLKEGEMLKSMNCDEIPTQTIKEKINQISSYIQDLVSLDCWKYADLYENLSKLERMRKNMADYWKKVMINEKTNDIQCKIKILKNIREMQDEKDETTKKIAEYLKMENNFMVKKLIKLLVRLQKLQCLIQKIVDHFDNRMKIGTIADTEKEIKFVDYLSSISFESARSEEEFVRSLKKEKHDSLRKEIKFLENLRLLLQKDDTYVTNEVAKQIWEMRNIEKLQQEAIEEMHVKLEGNMKIRKELKILFDLLHQIEASEEACERLLLKVGDGNIVSAQFSLKNGKHKTERPNLSEILEKIRNNAKKALASRRSKKKR